MLNHILLVIEKMVQNQRRRREFKWLLYDKDGKCSSTNLAILCELYINGNIIGIYMDFDNMKA